MRKNEAREGPRGEGEATERTGEMEEEHHVNITNVNKTPNLGGRSAIVHGPSRRRRICGEQASEQRVGAEGRCVDISGPTSRQRL
jgi:hypothetical protein